MATFLLNIAIVNEKFSAGNQVNTRLGSSSDGSCGKRAATAAAVARIWSSVGLRSSTIRTTTSAFSAVCSHAAEWMVGVNGHC